MSSESDFRDAIRSVAEAPTTGIDTDAVLRGARARRVPKQIMFSSLSVLAIAGIATLGINLIPSMLPGPNSASDSATMSMASEAARDNAQDAGSSNSYAPQLEHGRTQQNLCGSPPVVAAPNSAGLELSVQFPETSPADGTDVVGTVLITNTGTTPVSGTTAVSPTVVVSRDGTIVWHSHGAMIMMAVEVNLKPGESHSYGAHFTAVECSPQDDEDGMFRENLPALRPGTYDVMAHIVFVPDARGGGSSDGGGSEGGSILVGGPSQRVELR